MSPNYFDVLSLCLKCNVSEQCEDIHDRALDQLLFHYDPIHVSSPSIRHVIINSWLAKIWKYHGSAMVFQFCNGLVTNTVSHETSFIMCHVDYTHVLYPCELPRSFGPSRSSLKWSGIVLAISTNKRIWISIGLKLQKKVSFSSMDQSQGSFLYMSQP